MSMTSWNRLLTAGAMAAAGAFGQAAMADTTPAPAATAAPAAPAPSPMPWPGMSTGLAANPYPPTLDAGPLGKITVDGVFSGLGLWQSNPAGDFFGRVNKQGYGDISNAQIIVNKSSGVLQFFFEAGAYSLPMVGSPYYRADTANRAFFGPAIQGFLKYAPNANFSIEAGALPTLQGAEYTFTFENYNIERGLLWNQENTVNKGVQANYTKGSWLVSASFNDGYDSDRYTSASGLTTYTFKNTDTLTFVAQGTFKKVYVNTLLSPGAQANSQVYNLIYSHTMGKWTISPYLQYTVVPNVAGITPSGSTIGGAVFVRYAFTPTISLNGRAEYISSSGAANLLYGARSNAFSLTLTPTYQKGIFFARGEFSYVDASSATQGLVFGSFGLDKSQARGVAEAGVLF
ncbi:MAG TPA: outer membrane beta-barrel protein [Caulobacteraceae bacterium]